MASTYSSQRGGVRSTAAINGHPIHPMLISFPIAFLAAAFITDLTYLVGADPFWARASLWLIASGFITGALAAIFGFIDFVTHKRVREHRSAWIHFLGNTTVLALALINWILRLDSPTASVLPWGIVLSALVAALLLVTGWYGGELTFRHKIGVIDAE